MEVCPSYRRLLSELWKLIFFPKGALKLFSRSKAISNPPFPTVNLPDIRNGEHRTFGPQTGVPPRIGIDAVCYNIAARCSSSVSRGHSSDPKDIAADLRDRDQEGQRSGIRATDRDRYQVG